MSGECVLRPVGDLLGEDVNILKDTISEALKEQPEMLIIDMERVHVIDSSGIGVLVASKNSAEEGNCKLVLKDVNSDIKKMFRIMRLNEYFSFKN